MCEPITTNDKDTNNDSIVLENEDPIKSCILHFNNTVHTPFNYGESRPSYKRDLGYMQ